MGLINFNGISGQGLIRAVTESVIVPVTDVLGPGTVINPQCGPNNAFVNRNVISARIDLTASVGLGSNNSNGVVVEGGGTGWGILLYFYTNPVDGLTRLILEVGRGNGSGPTGTSKNQRGYVEFVLPNGTNDYIIEFSARRSNPTICSLYVNGILVGSDTAWSTSRLSGGNPGAICQRNSSARISQFGSNPPNLTNTNITAITIWNNQTV